MEWEKERTRRKKGGGGGREVEDMDMGGAEEGKGERRKNGKWRLHNKVGRVRLQRKLQGWKGTALNMN